MEYKQFKFLIWCGCKLFSLILLSILDCWYLTQWYWLLNSASIMALSSTKIMNLKPKQNLPGLKTPVVETGPSSKIRLTVITPPTLLIVQPRPCPFCLSIRISFNPGFRLLLVTVGLFEVSTTFSCGSLRLSWAPLIMRTQRSRANSVGQQKTWLLALMLKRKQFVFFLDSWFSMEEISITEKECFAARPFDSSFLFWKMNNISSLRTTNRGHHLFKILVFFLNSPSFRMCFLVCASLSPVAIISSLQQTWSGAENWQPVPSHWRRRTLFCNTIRLPQLDQNNPTSLRSELLNVRS